MNAILLSPALSSLLSTSKEAEKTSPASMSPMKYSEGNILTLPSPLLTGTTDTALTSFGIPLATSKSIFATSPFKIDFGASTRISLTSALFLTNTDDLSSQHCKFSPFLYSTSNEMSLVPSESGVRVKFTSLFSYAAKLPIKIRSGMNSNSSLFAFTSTFTPLTELGLLFATTITISFDSLSEISEGTSFSSISTLLLSTFTGTGNRTFSPLSLLCTLQGSKCLCWYA
ncbi:hypothetical protein ES705_32659 [subsurface metagenome]